MNQVAEQCQCTSLSSPSALGTGRQGLQPFSGRRRNGVAETALSGEKAQPRSASLQSLPLSLRASASTPIKTQLDTIHGAVVLVRLCEMILDSSQMNILKSTLHSCISNVY